MHKIQKIEIEISKSYEIKNVVIVYFLDVYFGLTAEKNENGRVRKQKLKERPKKCFHLVKVFLVPTKLEMTGSSGINIKLHFVIFTFNPI